MFWPGDFEGGGAFLLPILAGAPVRSSVLSRLQRKRSEASGADVPRAGVKTREGRERGGREGKWPQRSKHTLVVVPGCL